MTELKECNVTKPYVFVSYSHDDKDVVHRDVEHLQKLGYNLWIDEPQLGIGVKWDERVLDVISDKLCKAILFFVSESSLSSEYCRRELNHSFDEQTRLIHDGEIIPILSVESNEISNFPSFITDFRKRAAVELQKDRGKFKSLDSTLKKLFGEELNTLAGSGFTSLEKRYDEILKSFKLNVPSVVPDLQSLSQSPIIPQPTPTVEPAPQTVAAPVKAVEEKQPVAKVGTIGFDWGNIWNLAVSNNAGVVEKWELQGSTSKAWMKPNSAKFKREHFGHSIEWKATNKDIKAQFYVDVNSASLQELSDKMNIILQRVGEEVISVNSNASAVFRDTKQGPNGFVLVTTDFNKQSNPQAVADFLIKATDILLTVIDSYL